MAIALLAFKRLSPCFAQQQVGGEFRINTFTVFDQRNSAIATFSNGNFVATWESFNQSQPTLAVLGQLLDGNAQKIGGEFQVSTGPAEEGSRVARLSGDNFVIVWENNDASNEGIGGQLYDGNGVRVGSEFQVNSFTAGLQNRPAVASLQNGNFVTVWRSQNQDGSSWGVYGQLYAGNGSVIGSEFQINSYTTNSQQDPAVAGLADSKFIVVWNSDGQDSSDWGVYGQLFFENRAELFAQLVPAMEESPDLDWPTYCHLDQVQFYAAAHMVEETTES